MLGYLAKPGVSAWCFGGVIVVDRVVKVVFRQSLFGAQKIRHGPDVFFPFWEMVPGQGLREETVVSVYSVQVPDLRGAGACLPYRRRGRKADHCG